MVHLLQFLLCDLIKHLAEFVPILVPVKCFFDKFFMLAGCVLIVVFVAVLLSDVSIDGVDLVVVNHLLRDQLILIHVAGDQPLLILKLLLLVFQVLS